MAARYYIDKNDVIMDRGVPVPYSDQAAKSMIIGGYNEADRLKKEIRELSKEIEALQDKLYKCRNGQGV